ncbi:MAG: hypothetical protein P4L46_08550 [Fimbriimonas sp.]|nr:hypothetical protein [Fimbriimonas sp.]
MLTLLVAHCLVSVTTKAVEPHIVAASLFKNGFAVVSREFDAPAPGTYTIEKIPSSSMGTLWFTASDGTKLDDVRVTEVSTNVKTDLSSLEGIMNANVGHEVRIGIRSGDQNLGQIQEGKLLLAGSDFLLLQTATSTFAVSKSQVTSMASVSGQLLYKTDVVKTNRVLRVEVSGKPGSVHMISLERGLTWAPAYAIDISDPKKLSIIGKATVMDDIEDLKNVEARFVTGFPNVPFSTYLDPLINGGTVNEFASMLEGIGDPNAVTINRRSSGFGGQGQSRMATNSLVMNGDFAESMNNSLLLGGQMEDLFFYKLPNVTAKKGDRTYQILFSAAAPFEEIYTWDLPDGTVNNIEYTGLPDGPVDVWHSLRFKNTSGEPFTTAVATIFKNGQILGQDAMHYTTATSMAEVKITKALDVHAEASESELNRQRGAIKNPGNYPLYDLVTIQGDLRIANYKAVKVHLRIKKELTGDMVAMTGNPTVVKTTKGLRSMNPGMKLEWNADIEPGKVLTITYKYNLYVRSMQ